MRAHAAGRRRLPARESPAGCACTPARPAFSSSATSSGRPDHGLVVQLLVSSFWSCSRFLLSPSQFLFSFNYCGRQSAAMVVAVTVAKAVTKAVVDAALHAHALSVRVPPPPSRQCSSSRRRNLYSLGSWLRAVVAVTSGRGRDPALCRGLCHGCGCGCG